MLKSRPVQHSRMPRGPNKVGGGRRSGSTSQLPHSYPRIEKPFEPPTPGKRNASNKNKVKIVETEENHSRRQETTLSMGHMVLQAIRLFVRFVAVGGGALEWLAERSRSCCGRWWARVDDPWSGDDLVLFEVGRIEYFGGSVVNV